MHGTHVETYLRHEEKYGTTPTPLKNQPDIDSHLIEIWRDFQQLSKSRQYAGMSGMPLPIGFELLDRYAQRYGIYDLGEFERWKGLIEAMDHAWLKIKAQQQNG